MARQKVLYDPYSGINKDIVWDAHCPEEGRIITYKDEDIKRANYEWNMTKYQELKARGNWSREIACIDEDDLAQIKKDNPEYEHLRGKDLIKWWRKFLNKPENIHYKTSPRADMSRR